MQLKKHKTLRSLLTEWINHYVITPGLHSDVKAEGLKLVQLWVLSAIARILSCTGLPSNRKRAEKHKFVLHPLQSSSIRRCNDCNASYKLVTKHQQQFSWKCLKSWKMLKVSNETQEPKLFGLSWECSRLRINPSFRILLDSIGNKQLILAVAQMTAGKVQHVSSYLREFWRIWRVMSCGLLRLQLSPCPASLT